MHLVIDCFKQVKGHGKSLGIYNLSRDLVRNLSVEKATHTDEEVRRSFLTVIGTSRNEDDFSVRGVNFIKITNYDPVRTADCLLWELFAVKHVMRETHADIALFPRGYLPMTGVRGCRMVPIIHDMIPFYYNENYPKYFGRIHNAYIMKRLKGSVRAADRVITISKASKSDICRYTGVDDKKISVINNGLTALFLNEERERATFSNDLPSEYIVAIASAYPHKNLEGVLKGYSAYTSYTKTPLDLVVIGVDSIPQGIVDPELEQKIHCIRYIADDKQYQEIVTGSSLMVFLSLIEGFGFPPLEAMQMGVPVICSDRSSLPEVAGDAAVLVDPIDAAAVGKMIHNVLADDDLKQELIKKGFDNISRFSWENIAKQYWDFIVDMGSDAKSGGKGNALAN